MNEEQIERIVNKVLGEVEGDVGRSKDEDYFYKEMAQFDIPERTASSMLRYALHGVPTGGFLEAVLSNNLVESFGRADEGNRKALFAIVQAMYNVLPNGCWGSPEKVSTWLSRGGLFGDREVQE